METALMYAAIGIALIVAFVWWRWTSVARGARRRHKRLLQLVVPIADKLVAKEKVSREEVEAVAQQPHARPLLYRMLSDLDATELFPEEHLTVASQAQAQLAFWLMHPNELQDPPEEVLPEVVIKKTVGDTEAAFHVLRYRMPEGHWAGRDWWLGLAGPFMEGEEPYSGPEGAFSRSGDKAGEADAEELVNWFVELGSQAAWAEDD